MILSWSLVSAGVPVPSQPVSTALRWPDWRQVGYRDGRATIEIEPEPELDEATLHYENW